jgi:cell division protein FtsL
MAAGAAVVFALVAVHVVLAEGQFRLSSLQRQADEAQARYIRLRLEAARLESPQRIVADAENRLGMVSPATVTYLTPAAVAAGPPPAATGAPVAAATAGAAPPAPRSAPDSTNGWAAAKHALNSRP